MTHEVVTYGIHRLLLAVKLEVDFSGVLILLDAGDQCAQSQPFSLLLCNYVQYQYGSQKSAVRIEEVAEIIVACQLAAIDTVNFRAA